MSDAFSLAGRVALVTGANAGIGRAIARAMAAAGATVICAGRSSCAAAAAEIVAAGGAARALTLDLAQPLPSDLFERTGPVDVLVNNAGIIRRADALDFGEDDWDAVMDVNLKAAFFLTQAFARAALARGAGGAVVNVASLLSFQGGIRVASYTAAKHGLAGVTKLLANEWAAKGIRVNAVAPGYVVTANTAAIRADAAREAAILARIPAGRWAEPEDVAGAVVFLASPAAAYVHGVILPVDGGWLGR